MAHSLSAQRENTRALAGMLLAAMVAALLMAADEIIDSWSDGHWLAVWVALWTVVFAALALAAPQLRIFASKGASVLAAVVSRRGSGATL